MAIGRVVTKAGGMLSSIVVLLLRSMLREGTTQLDLTGWWETWNVKAKGTHLVVV